MCADSAESARRASHTRAFEGQLNTSTETALRIARSGQTAIAMQYEVSSQIRVPVYGGTILGNIESAASSAARSFCLHATAVEMWLMPVAEVLKLSELKPHQELRAAGKLVRWNASMEGVFFLSHQWTSFTRPDHSNMQLLTIQRLLTRMLQGDLPDTAPLFVDAARFASKVKISSREWKSLAPRAFIWLDYISVRAGVIKAIQLPSNQRMVYLENNICYRYSVGPSSRNLH